MILYINSCVRRESRTHWLACQLLDRLGKYTEVNLEMAGLSPLDRETLALRTHLINEGDYSHPMFDHVKQFARADTIVISAPFWDLSFPAQLKTYIENIYVTGLVSRYGSDGLPVGLCKAKSLYYVTTAGGSYNGRYSYDYIKELARTCFGIPETHLISAEMLDVDGFDADHILRDCAENLDRL